MRYLLAAVVLMTILSFAPAERAREVREPVQRGAAALKKLQHGDGGFGNYGPGSTSLAALALIESDVAKDDPVIASAARYVRSTAVRSTHTYSISLAIVLLDRLGAAEDDGLVKLLTERLLTGQKKNGGWSYRCPIGELGDWDTKFPAAGPADSSQSTGRSDESTEPEADSDNSNTQFAILAAWVGRRHGVDIDDAMRRVEDRYRKTVERTSDGAGWPYTSNDGVTGARTCCGLLGLAASAGNRAERRMKSAPEGSPNAEKSDARARVLRDPLVADAFQLLIKEYSLDCNQVGPQAARPNYYFYWSMERVAVAYGPMYFAGYDWYRAGIARLLPFQGADGLWTGHYGPEVETSFALLFLNRSNLTRDLSNMLSPRAATTLRTDGKGAAAAATPTISPEAEKLVKEFFQAPPDRRPALLAEYRDKKGVTYTEALAGIIPKLTGALADSARAMLAERLARMTAATLRERLKDLDVELRRAAATAAGEKDDKSLLADLIDRLEDDAPVALAAMGSLKKLSGEDHGPPAKPTADQISQAIAAWQEWWKKRGP